jgi:hypothetical protein
VGAWLSAEAAKLVADYRVATEPKLSAVIDDLLSDSANLVEVEIKGLLRSIASTLDASSGSSSFPLGAGGRFTSDVGRAILFRTPVDLYSQLDFLRLTYQDFAEAIAAGKFKSAQWRVELTATGDTSLVAVAERRKSKVPSPGVGWVQARAISVADLKRR